MILVFFNKEMVPSPLTGTPPIEDQGKLLDEALQVVKVQAFHMRKFLVSRHLQLLSKGL